MNSKNSILLVDTEFDPATATSCTLLIKVTADSYSYAIIDRSAGKLKALYDQQESADPIQDFAGRLKTDNYLALPFQEVKAAIYTPNTIAVPAEFVDEQNLDQYAKFFSTGQSDKLHAQKSDSFNFTSIFNIDSNAEKILNESFADCKIVDQSAPLLCLNKQPEQNALLVDFTAGSFQINYTGGNNLLFQHTYEISNDDEFNYYLLLMIKQLDIETKAVGVLVSGIIQNDDNRFKILGKYFNNIEFNVLHREDLNIDLLKDMPNHYYSTILAVDLCG
ncbi:DUF3822 family protein [Pedobacter sp. UYP24]